MDLTTKPSLALHKFTSDDGCQLAFLNAGDDLLVLSDLVKIVHFVQAGVVDFNAKADIAFIEGSISTPEEATRIKKVRENSQYLITIGACATAGGIQALRNYADHKEWVNSIYANPQFIDVLATSTPISEHVKVDFELWGCPINTAQVLDAVRALLSNATPTASRESLCIECKRKGHVCVLVANQAPCMGPVTRTGCGALCPSLGRACYACYGPSENPNTEALGKRFNQLGIISDTITRQFLHINNDAPAFKKAAQYFKGIKIIKEQYPS